MAGNTSNISGTQEHKGAYNEYRSDRNKTMCTS